MGAQLHAPAALPPVKRKVSYCIGGWVGPRAGLGWCEKSHPSGDSIPVPFSPYRVAIPLLLLLLLLYAIKTFDPLDVSYRLDSFTHPCDKIKPPDGADMGHNIPFSRYFCFCSEQNCDGTAEKGNGSQVLQQASKAVQTDSHASRKNVWLAHAQSGFGLSAPIKIAQIHCQHRLCSTACVTYGLSLCTHKQDATCSVPWVVPNAAVPIFAQFLSPIFILKKSDNCIRLPFELFSSPLNFDSSDQLSRNVAWSWRHQTQSNAVIHNFLHSLITWWTRNYMRPHLHFYCVVKINEWCL